MKIPRYPRAVDAEGDAAAVLARRYAAAGADQALRDDPVGPARKGQPVARALDEPEGPGDRGQVVRAEILADHQAQEGEDDDGDGQRGQRPAQQRAGGDPEGHREYRVADGDDALDVELAGLE